MNTAGSNADDDANRKSVMVRKNICKGQNFYCWNVCTGHSYKSIKGHNVFKDPGEPEGRVAWTLLGGHAHRL